MVMLGLLANFFHEYESLWLSAHVDARSPCVTLDQPLAAALVTWLVTLNSTPPAGQLDDEKPFAKLFFSIWYAQVGWFFQVVAEEIGLVAHTCTSRTVQDHDQFA